MEVGLVRSIDIDQEMQQAYLDYAMSVIVARALPDARDGMKPVHRRILYAMYDMGLRPETDFKKSARIVGEVLGKYHPHGDLAVYEAMARMAQDFSMRYLLVQGQGNFGSVDGDPPAAMRYTEARLGGPAMDMLADIRKNTVNFSNNFDSSLTEPDVLPAALPNLLLNGATGIAVGMSTNIPPHNLSEVIDALVYMLENWGKLDDVNVDDLMRFIKGPDFPTGGVIVQTAEDEDLQAAYGSGRGKVTVQARAHIEEMERGRSRIIVTELPYMTNKSSLIERIAELSREGRLEGLSDLRDESDRQGLRIVIELSKTADPEPVLQELYRLTPLRSTFGIIMLALVDGEPRMLSLKQALRVYLDHRLVVIQRRSEFDLERLRQRLHILEGLRVALKNLDEVIALIRSAPDVESARTRLMKRFRLSEIQAQSILDMQLRRLAALERKKIEEEYKEVLAGIKGLEALLRSPLKMRQVAAEELKAVKEAYGDRRRTQIVRLGEGVKTSTSLLAATALPEKASWVSLMPNGIISRSLEDKPPRLSGSAAPKASIRVNTRDTLYLVSETGEAAATLVHSLPETENPTEGSPFYKICALSEGDQLAALFALPPKDERPEGWFVLASTHLGMVKKTAVAEFPGPSTKTFSLIKVSEGDAFGWVRLTDGKADVFLATADGMAIRFSEEEVRSMGMVAGGVSGIKLGGRDELIGMEVFPKTGEILFISADGKAKRVAPDQFPLQGRYGQGVMAWKLPRTTQVAGIAAGKGTDRITLVMNKLAPKAIRLDEAPLQTRSASGKTIIDVKAGDRVIDLVVPWEAPHMGVSQAEAEKPARKRAPRLPATQTAEKAVEEKIPSAKAVKKAPEKTAVKQTVKKEAVVKAATTLPARKKAAASPAAGKKVAAKTKKAAPTESKPAAPAQGKGSTSTSAAPASKAPPKKAPKAAKETAAAKKPPAAQKGAQQAAFEELLLEQPPKMKGKDKAVSSTKKPAAAPAKKQPKPKTEAQPASKTTPAKPLGKKKPASS
jgi:DNA gyrase subunit A